MAAVLVTSTIVVLLGAAPAADGTTYSTTTVANVSGPLGVAAAGSDLYVSGPYFDSAGYPVPAAQQTVEVTDVATGAVSATDAIPSMLSSAFCAPGSGNSCPSLFYVEPYLAVSAGLGGFPAGEIYITQGPNIYEMAAGGGPITLFTTVPGLFPNVPLSGPYPEYSSGITFDTVGSFHNDMIVTSTNGSVWMVTSTGSPTLIGNTNTVIEGPAVAPSSFVQYQGDVLVAAEDAGGGSVIALSPTGASTVVAPVAWAEGVQVVPNPLCGVAGPDGSQYTWFGSMYGNGTVGALATSDFTGLSGDVVVQGEDSGMVTLLSSTSSTSTTSTPFVTGLPQQEGATVDQCAASDPPPPPPPPGTARTVGFWRNKNGNAVLDPDGSGTLEDPPSATLGSTSRGTTVTTLKASNDILSGGICNYVSCSKLSAGLHANTFDVLAEQTLALAYNVADTTFQGLVFSSCASYLGPLASLGLSSSSTIPQVLNVANGLIASSGAGGTTTQAQAGAMNSLLGQCVNLER